MNNDTTITTSFADDWLQKHQEFLSQRVALRPANKQAVFDLLAEAGITEVSVTFDGYGDSGQIESVTLCARDGEATMPTANVSIRRVEFGNSEPFDVVLPLGEAIELLLYDFLADAQVGWENDVGSFGDFVLNVPERAITLNYNERIETSEYFQHVY